ncbi:MAG: DNA-binding protein [Planctomycetes bacterium]|nr:DNA-binding protein [Planctomycetota bacterium]
MSTITIPIPQEPYLRLKEMAARLGVSAEELARACLEDLLARPPEEFGRALDHVLKKNSELYRRLA